MPIDAVPSAPPPSAVPTLASTPPTPPPRETPLPALHALRFHPLEWHHPWLWLQQGWQDFRRCPCLGLFYGACFMAMGWLLWEVFHEAPAYALALSASFLFVTPFLGLGLYYASWRIERGLTPDLGRSLWVWDTRPDTLPIFALVLLAIELLWSTVSLVVFAVFLERPLTLDGTFQALWAPENRTFVIIYSVVTLVFCALVFAISVISTPLMLDQHVDAAEAIEVSLRLVAHQPGVMLLWAAILGFLSVLAMLPGFAGWLIIGPLLGHASWHAYRSAVQDVTPLVVVEDEAPPVIDIPLSHELRNDIAC